MKIQKDDQMIVDVLCYIHVVNYLLDWLRDAVIYVLADFVR